MDANALLEDVRTSAATELDRLGSEKVLVAETAAQLDRESVLEAAAVAELRAAETLESWADEEADERAERAFREAAARERDHYATVTDLGGSATDPDPDALHKHLRGLERTCPRVAAGLVARPLVASRTLLQVINFFVNEGESAPAETFRELRSETDAAAESGAELAVTVCESGDPAGAAVKAIEIAYEAYADTLEGMGVDPKPVC